MNARTNDQPWREVLDFWFPEGCSLSVDAATHRDHWFWRMQGARMERSSPASPASRSGRPREASTAGRRRPKAGWRSSSCWTSSRARSGEAPPRAFAHDPAALSLALEGLSNGHCAALPAPWFKVVHSLPLGHCEGPDHIARLVRLIALREEIAAEAPAPLQPIYASLVKQAREVHNVITAFDRHPHRNAVLGRTSTPAEERYIAEGQFPHRRAFQE